MHLVRAILERHDQALATLSHHSATGADQTIPPRTRLYASRCVNGEGGPQAAEVHQSAPGWRPVMHSEPGSTGTVTLRAWFFRCCDRVALSCEMARDYTDLNLPAGRPLTMIGRGLSQVSPVPPPKELALTVAIRCGWVAVPDTSRLTRGQRTGAAPVPTGSQDVSNPAAGPIFHTSARTVLRKTVSSR